MHKLAFKRCLKLTLTFAMLGLTMLAALDYYYYSLKLSRAARSETAHKLGYTDRDVHKMHSALKKTSTKTNQPIKTGHILSRRRRSVHVRRIRRDVTKQQEFIPTNSTPPAEQQPEIMSHIIFKLLDDEPVIEDKSDDTDTSAEKSKFNADHAESAGTNADERAKSKRPAESAGPPLDKDASATKPPVKNKSSDKGGPPLAPLPGGAAVGIDATLAPPPNKKPEEAVKAPGGAAVGTDVTQSVSGKAGAAPGEPIAAQPPTGAGLEGVFKPDASPYEKSKETFDSSVILGSSNNPISQLAMLQDRLLRKLSELEGAFRGDKVLREKTEQAAALILAKVAQLEGKMQPEGSRSEGLDRIAQILEKLGPVEDKTLLMGTQNVQQNQGGGGGHALVGKLQQMMTGYSGGYGAGYGGGGGGYGHMVLRPVPPPMVQNNIAVADPIARRNPAADSENVNDSESDQNSDIGSGSEPETEINTESLSARLPKHRKKVNNHDNELPTKNQYYLRGTLYIHLSNQNLSLSMLKPNASLDLTEISHPNPEDIIEVSVPIRTYLEPETDTVNGSGSRLIGHRFGLSEETASQAYRLTTLLLANGSLLESEMTDWSAWSACTVTCGNGYSVRRRVCVTWKRNNCEEQRQEVGQCTEKECPAETTKTPTKEDDDDETDRRARFDLKHLLRALSLDVKSQVASQERTTVSQAEILMIHAKNNRVQPVGSSSSNSLPPWSEWSACSVSCGVGEQSRLRLCPDNGSNSDDQCHQNSYMKRNCQGSICTEASVGAMVTVMSGESVNLHCPLNTYQPPASAVYWMTPQGVKVISGKSRARYKILGHMLFIRHTDPRDDGKYQCLVERVEGETDIGEVSLGVSTCADSNPCQNGGECYETKDETDTRSLSTGSTPSPKRNRSHGFRRDAERTYFVHCACLPGFSGSLCEEKGISDLVMTFGSMFIITCAVILLCVVCCCCIWKTRKPAYNPVFVNRLGYSAGGDYQDEAWQPMLSPDSIDSLSTHRPSPPVVKSDIEDADEAAFSDDADSSYSPEEEEESATGADAHQTASYQSPSHQTPSYQTPPYQTPSYQTTPLYQTPSYDEEILVVRPNDSGVTYARNAGPTIHYMSPLAGGVGHLPTVPEEEQESGDRGAESDSDRSNYSSNNPESDREDEHDHHHQEKQHHHLHQQQQLDHEFQQKLNKRRHEWEKKATEEEEKELHELHKEREVRHLDRELEHKLMKKQVEAWKKEKEEENREKEHHLEKPEHKLIKQRVEEKKQNMEEGKTQEHHTKHEDQKHQLHLGKEFEEKLMKHQLEQEDEEEELRREEEQDPKNKKLEQLMKEIQQLFLQHSMSIEAVKCPPTRDSASESQDMKAGKVCADSDKNCTERLATDNSSGEPNQSGLRMTFERDLGLNGRTSDPFSYLGGVDMATGYCDFGVAIIPSATYCNGGVSMYSPDIMSPVRYTPLYDPPPPKPCDSYHNLTSLSLSSSSSPCDPLPLPNDPSSNLSSPGNSPDASPASPSMDDDCVPPFSSQLSSPPPMDDPAPPVTNQLSMSPPMDASAPLGSAASFTKIPVDASSPHGSTTSLTKIPVGASSPHGSTASLTKIPVYASSPHGSTTSLTKIPVYASSPHGSTTSLTKIPVGASSPHGSTTSFTPLPVDDPAPPRPISFSPLVHTLLNARLADLGRPHSSCPWFRSYYQSRQDRFSSPQYPSRHMDMRSPFPRWNSSGTLHCRSSDDRSYRPSYASPTDRFFSEPRRGNFYKRNLISTYGNYQVRPTDWYDIRCLNNSGSNYRVATHLGSTNPGSSKHGSKNLPTNNSAKENPASNDKLLSNLGSGTNVKVSNNPHFPLPQLELNALDDVPDSPSFLNEPLPSKSSLREPSSRAEKKCVRLVVECDQKSSGELPSRLNQQDVSDPLSCSDKMHSLHTKSQPMLQTGYQSNPCATVQSNAKRVTSVQRLKNTRLSGQNWHLYSPAESECGPYVVTQPKIRSPMASRVNSQLSSCPPLYGKTTNSRDNVGSEERNMSTNSNATREDKYQPLAVFDNDEFLEECSSEEELGLVKFSAAPYDAKQRAINNNHQSACDYDEESWSAQKNATRDTVNGDVKRVNPEKDNGPKLLSKNRSCESEYTSEKSDPLKPTFKMKEGGGCSQQKNKEQPKETGKQAFLRSANSAFKPVLSNTGASGYSGSKSPKEAEIPFTCSISPSALKLNLVESPSPTNYSRNSRHRVCNLMEFSSDDESYNMTDSPVKLKKPQVTKSLDGGKPITELSENSILRISPSLLRLNLPQSPETTDRTMEDNTSDMSSDSEVELRNRIGFAKNNAKCENALRKKRIVVTKNTNNDKSKVLPLTSGNFWPRRVGTRGHFEPSLRFKRSSNRISTASTKNAPFCMRHNFLKGSGKSLNRTNNNSTLSWPAKSGQKTRLTEHRPPQPPAPMRTNLSRFKTCGKHTAFANTTGRPPLTSTQPTSQQRTNLKAPFNGRTNRVVPPDEIPASDASDERAADADERANQSSLVLTMGKLSRSVSKTSLVTATKTTSGARDEGKSATAAATDGGVDPVVSDTREGDGDTSVRESQVRSSDDHGLLAPIINSNVVQLTKPLGPLYHKQQSACSTEGGSRLVNNRQKQQVGSIRSTAQSDAGEKSHFSQNSRLDVDRAPEARRLERTDERNTSCQTNSARIQKLIQKSLAKDGNSAGTKRIESAGSESERAIFSSGDQDRSLKTTSIFSSIRSGFNQTDTEISKNSVFRFIPSPYVPKLRRQSTDNTANVSNNVVECQNQNSKDNSICAARLGAETGHKERSSLDTDGKMEKDASVRRHSNVGSVVNMKQNSITKDSFPSNTVRNFRKPLDSTQFEDQHSEITTRSRPIFPTAVLRNMPTDSTAEGRYRSNGSQAYAPSSSSKTAEYRSSDGEEESAYSKMPSTTSKRFVSFEPLSDIEESTTRRSAALESISEASSSKQFLSERPRSSEYDESTHRQMSSATSTIRCASIEPYSDEDVSASRRMLSVTPNYSLQSGNLSEADDSSNRISVTSVFSDRTRYENESRTGAYYYADAPDLNRISRGPASNGSFDDDDTSYYQPTIRGSTGDNDALQNPATSTSRYVNTHGGSQVVKRGRAISSPFRTPMVNRNIQDVSRFCINANNSGAPCVNLSREFRFNSAAPRYYKSPASPPNSSSHYTRKETSYKPTAEGIFSSADAKRCLPPNSLNDHDYYENCPTDCCKASDSCFSYESFFGGDDRMKRISPIAPPPAASPSPQPTDQTAIQKYLANRHDSQLETTRANATFKSVRIQSTARTRNAVQDSGLKHYDADSKSDKASFGRHVSSPAGGLNVRRGHATSSPFPDPNYSFMPFTYQFGNSHNDDNSTAASNGPTRASIDVGFPNFHNTIFRRQSMAARSSDLDNEATQSKTADNDGTGFCTQSVYNNDKQTNHDDRYRSNNLCLAKSGDSSTDRKTLVNNSEDDCLGATSAAFRRPSFASTTSYSGADYTRTANPSANNLDSPTHRPQSKTAESPVLRSHSIGYSHLNGAPSTLPSTQRNQRYDKGRSSPFTFKGANASSLWIGTRPTQSTRPQEGASLYDGNCSSEYCSDSDEPDLSFLTRAKEDFTQEFNTLKMML